MAYNKLNPHEKEMLIRLYRRNPNTTMSEFCAENNVSTGAFKNWVRKYDEGGLAALYRTKKTPSLLPEGVDENEENLRPGGSRGRLQGPARRRRGRRRVRGDRRLAGLAPDSNPTRIRQSGSSRLPVGTQSSDDRGNHGTLMRRRHRHVKY